MAGTVVVRDLGRAAYEEVFEQMKAFTAGRDEGTADELWFVEHDPVFTQGQAGKAEHVLAATDIPIVQSDRGGQVTYHGPGQVVCYLMLDIRRLGINIRQVVTGIEDAMIRVLAGHGIQAASRREAPGVYIDGRKIGALGLRVRRGCTYHGLSLNVDMDLGPFSWINPCGMAGLDVTDMKSEGVEIDTARVVKELEQSLVSQFAYDGSRGHG